MRGEWAAIHYELLMCSTGLCGEPEPKRRVYLTCVLLADRTGFLGASRYYIAREVGLPVGDVHRYLEELEDPGVIGEKGQRTPWVRFVPGEGWRIEPRESIRFGAGASYVERLRAAGGKASPDLRRRVFERDGHRCVWCGAEGRLDLDHIRPVSRDGKTEESNLQVLCRSCNSRKGNRLVAVQ